MPVDASQVELLAPAGSFEALRAAVENGADAVYLGGQAFHARGRAVNFGMEELAQAVDYAHAKGVRIYLTVNTLLTNEEFAALGPYLEQVRELGVDALIVQDLGVMQFARTHFPDLPVHMSTQASIHNARSVQLLKDWGVERIILPRELELGEIQRMAGDVPLPLEVFVHGAQCYSYSGQCLASSLIGGRSGNRGKCASTCRLPYELLKSEGAVAQGAQNKPGNIDAWEWQKVDTPEGVYLESSRDMCTIDALPDILGTGVVSLKIEGRMRRPEYVAVVTNIYRRGLDRLAKGNFHITPEERMMLTQAFSRDFAPGYFLGNPGNAFVAPERPDNRGVFLGTVRFAAGDRMEIALEAPLRVGDGIEVWGQRGDFGERVDHLQVRHRATMEAKPGDIVTVPKHGWAQPGDKVYKSNDLRLFQWAQRTFQTEERRVDATLRAVLAKGTLGVLLVDGEGQTGEARVALAKAAGPPVPPDFLKKLLKDADAPGFKLRAFDVAPADGAYVLPKPAIEQALLEAAEALTHARQQAKHRAPREVAKPFSEFLALPERPKPARPELAVACPNIQSVRAALAGGADSIYYAPLDYGGDLEEWRLDRVEEALKACQAAGKPFWLHLPYITRDHDMAYIEGLVPRLRELGVDRVIAGNLGVLHLAQEQGWQVRADYFLNAFNGYALRVLRDMGVASVALSPELNLQQMGAIAPTSPVPIEAIVHGQLHLMISEHCIIGAVEGCYGPQGKHVPCRRAQYALKDEGGYVFPLVTDGKCRMHMMNSRELAMADRLPELLAAGLDVWRIHAVGLNAANLEAVVRAHVEALDAHAAGAYDVAKTAQQLQQARTLKLTTGHFFRGAL